MDVLKFKHILIVDDSYEELEKARAILADDYELDLMNSGRQALDYLSERATDLVLLDIMMPGLDGIEVMKRIQSDERLANIPVILMSTERDHEAECLDLGAADFIMKPSATATVKMRVKRALEYSDAMERMELSVEVEKERIIRMQQRAIMGFADLIESRDDLTGRHVKQTSAYVKALIDEIKQRGIYGAKYSDEYYEMIINAAPMHDIGKIRIPDAVLCKPGKLDEDEFAIMKTHAYEGYKILEHVLKSIQSKQYITIAENVAHYHHEKWNGAGYPDGLKEDEIPVEARIMAIADVFDALISKRCYKEAMSMDKAFSIIEESSGSHFDPELTKIFLDIRPTIEEIAAQA